MFAVQIILSLDLRQGRIQGGANVHLAPPGALQGGHLPPLESEVKKRQRNNNEKVDKLVADPLFIFVLTYFYAIMHMHRDRVPSTEIKKTFVE